MKLKKILITFEIQEKIFKKHKITRTQVEGVFFDEPIFLKTRNQRYTAIGFIDEYVTVIFNIKENNATIITAYKSSKWQKKLYKR